MSRTRGSKLSGAVTEAKSGQAVWEAVSLLLLALLLFKTH